MCPGSPPQSPASAEIPTAANTRLQPPVCGGATGRLDKAVRAETQRTQHRSCPRSQRRAPRGTLAELFRVQAWSPLRLLKALPDTHTCMPTHGVGNRAMGLDATGQRHLGRPQAKGYRDKGYWTQVVSMASAFRVFCGPGGAWGGCGGHGPRPDSENPVECQGLTLRWLRAKQAPCSLH